MDWGIIFSVAGKKLFDRLNIASLRCDQRVLLSIQFELLGDGSESHFDCFGTNLSFIFRKAVVSHIASKGSQKLDFLPLFTVKGVWGTGMISTGKVLFPSLKILLPLLGSRLHDAMRNGSLDSSEITLEIRPVLRRQRFQYPSFGGLNLDKKYVRKSVRFVVCSLELKSAMTLKIPGMCSAANFPTSNLWNRIARALIMLDAIWDVLFQSLYNQATAGMLSHQITTEQCCKSSGGTIVSSTSHCKRMPANLT